MVVLPAQTSPQGGPAPVPMSAASIPGNGLSALEMKSVKISVRGEDQDKTPPVPPFSAEEGWLGLAPSLSEFRLAEK